MLRSDTSSPNARHVLCIVSMLEGIKVRPPSSLPSVSILLTAFSIYTPLRTHRSPLTTHHTSYTIHHTPYPKLQAFIQATKMRFAIASAALALVSAVAAIPNTVFLTNADNGANIDVAYGTVINVSLLPKSNQTSTGNKWSWTVPNVEPSDALAVYAQTQGADGRVDAAFGALKANTTATIQSFYSCTPGEHMYCPHLVQLWRATINTH
ncbi:hypothetical protein GQ42DRAFT_21686 [Ramicandelaber brevisporus]|nr:hypothetical protein GQ42DRAFT_21686 [Ramicandelaber brevisporus]